MNDKILKRAEARIDAKRHFADDRARENLLIAYKNPKFKELYNKEREMEIEIARKEAYGEPYDTKELTLLNQQIEFCLKEIGLNGTDIKPNYECKECLDTGYVEGRLCDCLKKEINKELTIFKFTCKNHVYNIGIFAPTFQIGEPVYFFAPYLVTRPSS